MYNKSLCFHLIGIGGSGMSGIAEVLAASGFRVSGSDLHDTPVVVRLRSLGISIAIGHHESHINPSISLVVISSAVTEDNVEVIEARKSHIPVIPRAEVLGELMRLKFGIAIGGAHGKTSTTTMVAKILEHGGLDPTSIVGGKVVGRESGATVGRGDFLVAEADESDRSFLMLRPALVVVTNIDKEHLEAYQHSFETLTDAFLSFVNSIPFYGLAVLCGDDDHIRTLIPRIHRRFITYGIEPHNEVIATDISVRGFSTTFSVAVRGVPQVTLTIPLPGVHFCKNALAAYCVGIELGLTPEVIADGLRHFKGVARRTELLYKDAGITIINDYGHHPVEIEVTIRALVEGGILTSGGRLLVAFQPHRYSRVEGCYEGFCNAFQEAHKVFVTDIYSAGEAPRKGILGSQLCRDIVIPHGEAIHTPTSDDLEERLSCEYKEGDVIVFFGAGSIGKCAERWTDAIRTKRNTNKKRGDSNTVYDRKVALA
jgi:UDP-N-acetylmuramate--alanine ligase